MNALFRAGRLATLAFRFSIPIPGTSASSRLDERAGAKLIGSLAADMFDSSTVLDLGNGRSVERREGRPAEDGDSDESDRYAVPSPTRETYCYLFKLAGGCAALVDKASKTPQATPDRDEHRAFDALEDFRKNLMTALADAGNPAPCALTSAQIAALFDDCSANTAGIWMQNWRLAIQGNSASLTPNRREVGRSPADVCKRQFGRTRVIGILQGTGGEGTAKRQRVPPWERNVRF